MVRDLRIKAQEIGDREMLRGEEAKRRAWRWENALRRWNGVGFIGEVVKGVAASKLGRGDDGEAYYDKWIEEAKAKTKARYEEKKKTTKNAGKEVDEVGA